MPTPTLMTAVFPQREPAEEALKSNHMNLDQAMSKSHTDSPAERRRAWGSDFQSACVVVDEGWVRVGWSGRAPRSRKCVTCPIGSTWFRVLLPGGVSPAARRVLATWRPSPWRSVAVGGTREGPSEKWPPKVFGPRGEDGWALRDCGQTERVHHRSEGREQGSVGGPRAVPQAVCAAGALLEKKADLDKRGLGVTDYNGMVTKPLGCRPPISKESSVDRPAFLDKVGGRVFVCLCEKRHFSFYLCPYGKPDEELAGQ